MIVISVIVEMLKDFNSSFFFIKIKTTTEQYSLHNFK